MGIEPSPNKKFHPNTRLIINFSKLLIARDGKDLYKVSSKNVVRLGKKVNHWREVEGYPLGAETAEAVARTRATSLF